MPSIVERFTAIDERLKTLTLLGQSLKEKVGMLEEALLMEKEDSE